MNSSQLLTAIEEQRNKASLHSQFEPTNPLYVANANYNGFSKKSVASTIANSSTLYNGAKPTNPTPDDQFTFKGGTELFNSILRYVMTIRHSNSDQSKSVRTGSWRYVFGILFVLFLFSSGVLSVNLDAVSLKPTQRHQIATNFGGAVERGHFRILDSLILRTENSGILRKKFRFAAIADLDQLSKLPTNNGKLKFHSILQPGVLSYSFDRSSRKHSYSLDFEKSSQLVSGHNEAGRGMELSELTIYNDRLLSFDDRTGAIFELLPSKGGDGELSITPRFVISEGNGNNGKGMKWEWATVKDNHLYIGSLGKEYTRLDGSVANRNNLWISIINEHGEIQRIDWTDKYNFIRSQLGASFPGYVIHEAVLWSHHIRKWIFIPRRISSLPYDDVADEKRGSNKLLLVDEHFKEAELIDIKLKSVNPLHGFSSAAFIPETNERHVLALRSVEENCVGGDESLCRQSTYAVIFDIISGEVLMDEVLLPENVKFEGVEFANIYVNPNIK